MSIISRLKLDHPALGTAGGAPLHAQIEAIYTKIGDMTNARFFRQNGLANGASVDFEHNFKTAFDDLRFDLYEVNTGTGELTEIYPVTGYTVAATPGQTTTQIRVTNSTGITKDIALVVVQDPVNLDELVDVEIASPANNELLTYETASSRWKNKAPSLGAGSTGTVVPGSYPFTITSAHKGAVILVDTLAARTVNLPAHQAGFILTIKDNVGNADITPITLVRNGASGSIDGLSADTTLNGAGAAYTFISDGVSNWSRIV